MGVIFIGIIIIVTAILALYWVFYGQRKHNEMLNPKRKTKLKAILFDLDGVIVDSFERQFVVFNELRKNYGLKIVSKDEFKRKVWGFSLDVSAEIYFKKQDYEKLHDVYNSLVKKHQKEGKLMEGAKEVLEAIKKKKIKIGLVTNTTKERAEGDLKLHKIRNFFDTVVTADDVEKPKPYPDPILKACKKLNVMPDEVMYVGDTKNDYKSGKSAGAFVIGFNTHGDLMISKLNDILQLL